MMDKGTVAELHRLYSRREDTQRAKTYAANRNFWLAIVNDNFSGTGTNSTIKDALGGPGPMADLLMRSAVEGIEAQMRTMDDEISNLGGTP